MIMNLECGQQARLLDFLTTFDRINSAKASQEAIIELEPEDFCVFMRIFEAMGDSQ